MIPSVFKQQFHHQLCWFFPHTFLWLNPMQAWSKESQEYKIDFTATTCVNSVIEIPLSLQCKIVQYKFLWQYPMKFQDFFSLCQVQQPAWLQLDHKKLGPSEMRFFRTLCHKTEKHARVCDIMLWKTLIRVSMNFYIYQEWVKIYLIIYQFLKPFI